MATNPMKEHSQPDLDSEDGTLFKGVIFELDPNISSAEQEKLKEQLVNHGAKSYNDEKNNGATVDRPTHYITDRGETANATYSVLPLWVTAAIRNGFTHDPKFYTPDPSKHFSGFVVATTGIPKRDQEAIFGVSLALGGQYREKLTPEVTHLVCLAPEGDMYEEAMGPLYGNTKVILPHWFDECFKLRRIVSDAPYLFPDPLFMRQQATSSQINEPITSSSASTPHKQPGDTANQPVSEQQNVSTSRSGNTMPTTSPTIEAIPTETPKDNTKYNDEASTASGPMVYTLPKIDVLKTLVPKDRFFDGKLIYIHSDVGLPPDMHAMLVQHLETAGGTVTNNYEDTKDHKSVIAIFKFRYSDLFWQISKRPEVMVANLAWITNTLIRGRVESPLRSICDYPVPYGGIIGMRNLTATISGYEGDARIILFQMCGMVGLPCSVNFDVNTTHLICSKRGTEKYKAAKKRNCHIVNHLWLEECFQQWELKSVADARYTHFPSNNILQNLVGKTPLTEDILKPWCDKDTSPAIAPYTPMHLLHRSPTPATSPSHKPKHARRQRQAALDASSQLRDVVIPDMNDYQKEQFRSSNNSPTALPSSPSLSSAAVKDLTTETGKHRRRHSASSPGSTELLASKTKRLKLENMKSKDASLKQTTPPSSSPRHSPKESSSGKTNTRQAPANRSNEESESADHLPEDGDEDMEDVSDSKQTPRTSSSFDFAVNPTKIATTSCELTKDEEKGIRKLGSTLVDDIRKADILVVPDRVLRTPKFLCAVNLGTTIVGYQWLKDSIAGNTWCNTSEYQVKDAAMEKSHSFKLFDSLLHAQKANQDGKGGSWLQGYEVCVLPSAGSAQALKDVVETAGGKITPVPKRRSRGSSQSSTDHHATLLALADKKDTKRKGWNDLKELDVKVYDKEMIAVGALRQKLALDEFFLA